MADPSLLRLHRQLAGFPASSATASSSRRSTFSINQRTEPSTPDVSTPEQQSVSAVPDEELQVDGTASTSAGTPAGTPGGSTVKRKLRSKDASSSNKKSKSSHPPPSTRLADLGGIDSTIASLLELVALPLCHPEIYGHTGVRPPRGVLLEGPPGCGKTMLAGAVAGELGVPFISISAPSIVSGMSGESEKALRETFEEAARLAPCILFIDEIDAITPKRETAQREMERRIVAQLLTCMDDLAWEKTDNKPVVILAATNRPDSLDPALRRAGRFDAEISLGVPDQAGRERILRVILDKLRLSGEFDYEALARGTPGYVGADLSALAGAAGVMAVKRIFEIAPEVGAVEGEGMLLDFEDEEATAANGIPPQQLEVQAHQLFANLPPAVASLPIATFLRSHPNTLTADQLATIAITNSDFTAALKIVQPSSQREGFTTVPNTTWAQVGALAGIRDEMRMSIVRPIRRPEMFERVGVKAPCGVLLWGPPGCGKTLLAKAVANESKANFISVKGPELLNKYVGESERAVRQVFARARASSPCIVFFDELDAMVPRRDDSLSESSARVVNTLLTELDGLDARKQVFVIGATNRPDILDPAMVRPGRLDKLLFVALPSPAERVDILKALTATTPLGPDVDLSKVAMDTRCEGFSGADLSSLAREAATIALRQVLDKLDAEEEAQDGGSTGTGAGKLEEILVGNVHWDAALARVVPSVSASERRRFDQLRAKFAGQPLGRKKENLDSAAATAGGVDQTAA